ncbi:hypothetical protein [Corynebacterium amycolatum]|uniref:hypothetical protein n=1 Tax=Corynebacterium amycolatum TaxID=43765 RepID=UPI000185BECB|nr:hypothetical protein [Corynebacterium amycolatum]EEB63590.1 hypothetical protein CORAM0001_1274 [Corynebacterium amycolatum SK46]
MGFFNNKKDENKRSAKHSDGRADEYQERDPKYPEVDFGGAHNFAPLPNFDESFGPRGTVDNGDTTGQEPVEYSGDPKLDTNEAAWSKVESADSGSADSDGADSGGVDFGGVEDAAEGTPNQEDVPPVTVEELSEMDVESTAGVVAENVVKQLDLIQTRLDTMNAVLRSQSEELETLTDRRWYAQLMPLAEKLAAIHDGICADLSRLEETTETDGSDLYSTLDFLQDSIADALQSMGVAITEAKVGDAFDSSIHRRTKFADSDNPALHRTLAPSRRISHYYTFTSSTSPIVVAKAPVTVYRQSGN